HRRHLPSVEALVRSSGEGIMTEGGADRAGWEIGGRAQGDSYRWARTRLGTPPVTLRTRASARKSTVCGCCRRSAMRQHHDQDERARWSADNPCYVRFTCKSPGHSVATATMCANR